MVSGFYWFIGEFGVDVCFFCLLLVIVGENFLGGLVGVVFVVYFFLIMVKSYVVV